MMFTCTSHPDAAYPPISARAAVLGVFLALAPRLWYPAYAGRTGRLGLSALEDQQLAGYIT